MITAQHAQTKTHSLEATSMADALGLLEGVNFIFLVVGHTKNAADRHFNLLKQDYWRKNLYMLNELVEAISIWQVVTVHPTGFYPNWITTSQS